MNKANSAIHIIVTGGTIDSAWDGRKDTIEVSRHSNLPKFFKGLTLHPKIKITEVCMKDSRQLKLVDIKKVAQVIEKSAANQIIITHGTYTMPDTARYLQVNLKRKDVTVILTGSMTPLVGFEPSDASFNLGYAVGRVQAMTPGVYICMNARTFKPEEVAKNLSEGKFYSVFQDQQ